MVSKKELTYTLYGEPLEELNEGNYSKIYFLVPYLLETEVYNIERANKLFFQL
jgi:hypothetical protein